MTIKVYVSGICGSQDVRKQQQRVLFILTTMQIDLQIIDVTEPGKQEDRDFMQEELKKHNKKDLLPPQIFNDNEYCGDYDDFQLAADDDVLMSFLKLEETSQNAQVPISNGHTNDTDVSKTNSEIIELSHQEPEESLNTDNAVDDKGEKIVDVSDEMVVENVEAETEPAVVNETPVEPEVVPEAEKSEEEEESSEEEESD